MKELDKSKKKIDFVLNYSTAENNTIKNKFSSPDLDFDLKSDPEGPNNTNYQSVYQPSHDASSRLLTDTTSPSFDQTLNYTTTVIASAPKPNNTPSIYPFTQTINLNQNQPPKSKNSVNWKNYSQTIRKLSPTSKKPTFSGWKSLSTLKYLKREQEEIIPSPEFTETISVSIPELPKKKDDSETLKKTNSSGSNLSKSSLQEIETKDFSYTNEFDEISLLNTKTVGSSNMWINKNNIDLRSPLKTPKFEIESEKNVNKILNLNLKNNKINNLRSFFNLEDLQMTFEYIRGNLQLPNLRPDTFPTKTLDNWEDLFFSIQDNVPYEKLSFLIERTSSSIKRKVQEKEFVEKKIESVKDKFGEELREQLRETKGIWDDVINDIKDIRNDIQIEIAKKQRVRGFEKFLKEINVFSNFNNFKNNNPDIYEESKKDTQIVENVFIKVKEFIFIKILKIDSAEDAHSDLKFYWNDFFISFEIKQCWFKEKFDRTLQLLLLGNVNKLICNFLFDFVRIENLSFSDIQNFKSFSVDRLSFSETFKRVFESCLDSVEEVWNLQKIKEFIFMNAGFKVVSGKRFVFASPDKNMNVCDGDIGSCRNRCIYLEGDCVMLDGTVEKYNKLVAVF